MYGPNPCSMYKNGKIIGDFRKWKSRGIGFKKSNTCNERKLWIAAKFKEFINDSTVHGFKIFKNRTSYNAPATNFSTFFFQCWRADGVMSWNKFNEFVRNNRIYNRPNFVAIEWFQKEKIDDENRMIVL